MTGSEAAPTTEGKEEEGSNERAPSMPQSEKATVKLIQAAWLPAGHSKLVRVVFGDSGVEVGTYLFEIAVKEAGKECHQDREEEVGDPPVAATVAIVGEEQEEKVLEALAVSPDTTGLKPEEAKKLRELVLELINLFGLSNFELGRTSGATHCIDTGDSGPVRQPARRVPFSLCSKVKKVVQMLHQGVITPSSIPWGSPIVLVAKKDSTTRFCAAYRRLNAITKLDVHPLSRTDDSLDLLASSAHWIWLLGIGKWGWTRNPKTITTHAGLYEFVVIPFCLCNAPATFQHLMEVVLRGIARGKFLVYMDDLLVIGRTFQEQIENLREVFTRLMEAGLKLKPRKCKFATCEVEFLGSVVSNGGLPPTQPRSPPSANSPRRAISRH